MVKSFARIHETNLKKQGILALTFNDKADYEKIQEKDRISFGELDQISPGKNVNMSVKHEDGSSDIIELKHTLNKEEIHWFKAGSALNYVGQKNG